MSKDFESPVVSSINEYVSYPSLFYLYDGSDEELEQHDIVVNIYFKPL